MPTVVAWSSPTLRVLASTPCVRMRVDTSGGPTMASPVLGGPLNVPCVWGGGELVGWVKLHLHLRKPHTLLPSPRHVWAWSVWDSTHVIFKDAGKNISNTSLKKASVGPPLVSGTTCRQLWRGRPDTSGRPSPKPVRADFFQGNGCSCCYGATLERPCRASGAGVMKIKCDHHVLRARATTPPPDDAI